MPIAGACCKYEAREEGGLLTRCSVDLDRCQVFLCIRQRCREVFRIVDWILVGKRLSRLPYISRLADDARNLLMHILPRRLPKALTSPILSQHILL